MGSADLFYLSRATKSLENCYFCCASLHSFSQFSVSWLAVFSMLCEDCIWVVYLKWWPGLDFLQPGIFLLDMI